MTGFARRPLAVLVCCMFAGVPPLHAAADDDVLLLAASSVRQKPGVAPVAAPVSGPDDDLPLRLRTERRFNVMGSKTPSFASGIVGVPYPVELRKDDVYPLFIVSDRLEGRTEVIAEASGEVELRRAGSLFYGEQMTYWPLDDEVEAKGSVRMLQEGQEINAPHLRLQLSEQVGFAEQPDFYIVKEVSSKFYRPLVVAATSSTSNAVTSGAPMMQNVPNSYGLPTVAPERRPSTASGSAERAEFEGENQISLFNTTYSTCKPGQADWYMRSTEVHLDYDREVGEAKHSVFYFKDVPFFYTPVNTFSLNHQRKSGVMHPFFSTSTRDGLDLTVPYYWNIAPNYDATIYPRYMTKRGFQLGAQTDYLDFNYHGFARAEYMPYDQLADRERYAYAVQHWQTLGQGFSAYVNYNRVSDNFYNQQMSSRLVQTTQVQLPQQFVLNYTPTPWLQTNLQVQQYQTLQTDPSSPITPPYFLEPQLNMVGFKPDVLGTDFTLLGQYSRFISSTKVQGDRLVAYPQFALPFVHPAFNFTPKVGLHATEYVLNNQPLASDPTNISRVMPTFTVDSSLIFERETSLLDKSFIQTLEPRLYYVNIPYKNQSNIPIFDTYQSDFNFAQIFSENRYSGFDRINDANQLTAALTTRMLDGTTGVERFKAMIGQVYYFRPGKVTLPGQATQTEGLSSVISAFSGLVLPKTYADVAWQYNFSENVNERFSAGMRFQPELGKVISAGYRYTRDAVNSTPTVDQIDISGQWPLSSRLYAVGRYNFSFLGNSQLLEGIAGIEYNAGCWAVRAVAQRLEAIAGSPNTTLFLQLELTDFGSVGSNPITLLRRSIPGYGKTNELSTSSSLLTTQ
jgi:LPS-assembly protein